MKQPSKNAKSARAASKRGVRLSAKDLAQVRAIAARVTLRATSRPKALLFSGADATTAAEAIAERLRRDLYRVHLSAVISKYIGETEKNLKRLFAAAEAKGAILLIDEADALFGKRTDVKDAHDRYSNIEIDYLLQHLTEHDGLVVFVSKPRLTLPTLWRRRFSVCHFPPP